MRNCSKRPPRAKHVPIKTISARFVHHGVSSAAGISRLNRNLTFIAAVESNMVTTSNCVLLIFPARAAVDTICRQNAIKMILSGLRRRHTDVQCNPCKCAVGILKWYASWHREFDYRSIHVYLLLLRSITITRNNVSFSVFMKYLNCIRSMN